MKMNMFFIIYYEITSQSKVTMYSIKVDSNVSVEQYNKNVSTFLFNLDVVIPD